MDISSEKNVLNVSPIGFIKNQMVNKFDAPHQPDKNSSSTSIITLLPNQDFHKALEDLSGFEYIWVLWWFHKNKTWKPKVLPPRGEGIKRGVFATRSPHRPNPIGISILPLISIQGRELVVGTSDLIDGTPILDIKPYIPNIDSYPDAKVGWIKAIEEEFQQAPVYEVVIEDLADKQLKWLQSRGVNFLERAITLLQRDPSENRTRRIKKMSEDQYRMGCGGWRIFYSINNSKVEIKYIEIGYKVSRLEDPDSECIPHRDEQLKFNALWPRGILVDENEEIS